MRVVAWNIQGGGGKRIGAIADELIRRNADVFVLGEYVRDSSERLVNRLAEAGWVHAVVPDPPQRCGGVAVVSRFALEPLAPVSAMGEQAAYRHVAVSIPLGQVQLRGVYGPLPGDPYAQFWDSMLTDLREHADDPILVMGDFNTGLAGVDNTTPTLFCSKYFAQLPDAGFTDLWREHNGAGARDYTWQCRNRGQFFPHRLDHAFGSSSVAGRLRGCAYDHTVREMRLSDHSLLAVEVAACEGAEHGDRPRSGHIHGKEVGRAR